MYEIGDTIVFNYTGSVQTYILPKEIKKVRIDCYAGQGGSGAVETTKGDYVSGIVNNNSYELLLTIYVGGQGEGGTSASASMNPKKGGFYGGYDGTKTSYGSGYYYGGGGGGASLISITGDPNDPIIEAKGGKGGKYGTATGGNGGGISSFYSLEDGQITANYNSGNGKIVFTILEINSSKYLIKQNNQYYSIKDNILTLLGIPTDDAQKEQWFDDYGVEDLKDALLTPDTNGNKLIDSLDNQFEVRMMKAK